MLQELSDVPGNDNNDDDTTFAELQSLLGVLKELEAAKNQGNDIANAEGFFSWIGRKIRKVARRFC